MERLNRDNRQFSIENGVSRNVCVSGNNRIEQEICNGSCCKIYFHDLSSDNLNKSLSEEYVPAYQCDKPSDYVFVDVGSNFIKSEYLLEEDDDICKVSSETLFTDSKDIDYNLVKNVTIERHLKNFSKEHEMHNHNLETTVFNTHDICTGNDRSGLSTNACMANMCENLNNYDKKPSSVIGYTTTSTDVGASRGFEKVNAYVKEEKSVEAVLVPQNTKIMCPEIKKEEMVYNEEVSVLNESVIDIKLYPLNKVEEPPDISTNVLCVLDKNSKAEFVLSKSVDSDFQEVHLKCPEEVSDNSDVGDVMVLKPLEKNEAVQNKKESHLKLQNEVQTLNGTCSELQIKPHTNSGDDTGAAGVEECNNKLNEDDVYMQAKNKNDVVCQHHKERKSKNTTVRHYVCKVCDKDFTQLCDLKAHKFTHTVNSPFLCDICGKTFRQSSNLKYHIRIHTGDRPFGCDTCGKSFRQSSNLKYHIMIHTGDRPFGCDTCGKTFTRRHFLKDHVCIHTDDKPFGCDTCGKAFTCVTSLKSHKRIHTGDTFDCDTCGKVFTHMITLKNHNRIHTGEKPFVCDICSKAFTNVNSLKIHNRAHTGDRPFVCYTCGKAFISASGLTWHKPVHTGNRHFVCDTCGKAFISASGLKRHKPVHTGNRHFVCDTCGKAFTYVTYLKRHKRTHTSDRALRSSV